MTNEELTKLFASTINFYDITRTSLCSYCKYGYPATCGCHICNRKDPPKEGLLNCVQSCNQFEIDPNVSCWDSICKTCENCKWIYDSLWKIDFPRCIHKQRPYTHDIEMCKMYKPSSLFIKENDVK